MYKVWRVERLDHLQGVEDGKTDSVQEWRMERLDYEQGLEDGKT